MDAGTGRPISGGIVSISSATMAPRVVPGDAATIAPLFSTYGPVTVYGADGKPKQ